MRYKAIYLMIFSCFSSAAYADSIEVCGEVRQGELLLIKTADARSVVVYDAIGIADIQKHDLTLSTVNGQEYPVSKDGTVLLALHRDAPKKMTLGVYPRNDMGSFYELTVAPNTWDVQKIKGVAPEKVTPSAAAQAEIARERRDVDRTVTHIRKGDFWRQGFMLPVEGPISGHFGNQRIFNGVPKNPHSGTDIAAPEGTAVMTSGDGIVVLNGKDYFYTGNMVIIDHGQGLQTIYAHLKDSAVQEGYKVQKGDIIGHVGKTGRATGPHLHWGASLHNIRFRPHSLLDIKEKSCKVFHGVYAGDFLQEKDNIHE